MFWLILNFRIFKILQGSVYSFIAFILICLKNFTFYEFNLDSFCLNFSFNKMPAHSLLVTSSAIDLLHKMCRYTYDQIWRKFESINAKFYISSTWVLTYKPGKFCYILSRTWKGFLYVCPVLHKIHKNVQAGQNQCVSEL